MQLHDRIAEHVETSARPLTLDDIEARLLPQIDYELPHRRRPTKLALTAAAVLMVIAATGVALAQLRNDADLTTADASPAPAFAALPGPLDELQWAQRIDPFPALDADASVVVRDLISSGDRAWVAGFEWKINDALETKKRGAIWETVDGITWTPVSGPFGDFDALPGTAIPAGVSFSHLVMSNSRPLAFGNDFSDTISPVAVRLADGGSTWERLNLGDLGGVEILRGAAFGERVAALVALDPNGRRQTVGLAESIDGGTTWELTAAPFADADLEDIDLAVGENTTVVVERFTSWTRSHGTETWDESAILDRSADLRFVDVDVTEAGFVVSLSSGSSGVSQTEGFLSADGRSWEFGFGARGLSNNEGSVAHIVHDDGTSALVNVGTSSNEPVRLFAIPQRAPLGTPMQFGTAVTGTIHGDEVLVLDYRADIDTPPLVWTGRATG